MQQKIRLYYFLVLLSIIIISFLFYSSLFYSALNSDNAVTILMIKYFDLPKDFYFWGQDRMGSIIPLLAQIPYKFFTQSILISESIVHYSILIIGFFCGAALLNTKFFKIIFAIVWFLPPMHFIDLTQFAFGIQYSLIFISTYLFNELENTFKIKNHLLALLIIVVLTMAVWVSDMSLISAVLFVLFLFINKKDTSINLKKWYLFYSILGLVLVFAFISFTKSNAVSHINYAIVGDFGTINKTLSIFFSSIYSILFFKADEPLTTVWAYFTIVIVILLGVNLSSLNIKEKTIRWAIFFFIEGILLLVLILISKWTLEANVPRRYFVCTYISFSISILIFLENLRLRKTENILLKSFIILTVLLGGFSSFYNLKYVWPKTLTPKSEVVAELNKLGSVGIIGEYWNSYINSINNPEKIISTPHDLTGAVRNYKIANSVFEQQNIYIVRDMWLVNFPDSITQFGHKLIKDGNEFKIAESNLCKYKLVKKKVVIQK